MIADGEPFAATKPGLQVLSRNYFSSLPPTRAAIRNEEPNGASTGLAGKPDTSALRLMGFLKHHLTLLFHKSVCDMGVAIAGKSSGLSGHSQRRACTLPLEDLPASAQNDPTRAETGNHPLRHHQTATPAHRFRRRVSVKAQGRGPWAGALSFRSLL